MLFIRFLSCLHGLFVVEHRHFLSREQKKTLAALEMELSAARQQGFVPKHADVAETKKRPLVVIGIMTSLGNRKKRDAVRQAWMGTGKLSHCLLFALLEYVLQFVLSSSF